MGPRLPTRHATDRRTSMKTTATFVMGTFLLLGASVWARVPADKCEIGELRASGRYGSCRLNVGARAASGGRSPAFGKCDARFADRWERAENKGDGQCPSSGDQAAIQGFLASCTDGVAAALAGGALPACPGQANATVRRDHRK